MSLAAAILAELDAEGASTRRMLEAVTDDVFDWKAHEKSYSIGEVSTHLANLLTWAPLTLQTEVFDAAPAGQDPPKQPEAKTAAEVLERFDTNLAAARAAIQTASDEELQATWTMQAAGKTLFTMPRSEVLRAFIVRHTVHHRAQLGVYLRLRDVPLPSTYGPTADEAMPGT